ncbi:MAG: hypothetical protein M3Z04_19395 [Chloroflexota bacterium]|nr:hypothetical protein [Chloroflexota bacterium]
MLPLLVEASGVISHYFGAAPVTYELPIDPDDGKTTKLVVSINPQVPPAEALG